MIGRGNDRIGGDKDFAALWQLEESEWFVQYSLRTTGLPRPDGPRDPRRATKRHWTNATGNTDEKWFGHTLEELREPVTRPATPAFARFHMDATLDIFESEGFGRDEITDFLWVELKMPDYAGHQWNMVSPEVGDVLRETDSQIAAANKSRRESHRQGRIRACDHGRSRPGTFRGDNRWLENQSARTGTRPHRRIWRRHRARHEQRRSTRYGRCRGRGVGRRGDHGIHRRLHDPTRTFRPISRSIWYRTTGSTNRFSRAPSPPSSCAKLRRDDFQSFGAQRVRRGPAQ